MTRPPYLRTLDPSRGGRPPGCPDYQLLARMPATVRELAAYAGVTRSAMHSRLAFLELEGRAERTAYRRGPGDLCDRWAAT